MRLTSVEMTRVVVSVRAAIRAVPELLGHAILPILIVSHPRNQLDLADRVDQPAMPRDVWSKECECEGLQHVV